MVYYPGGSRQTEMSQSTSRPGSTTPLRSECSTTLTQPTLVSRSRSATLLVPPVGRPTLRTTDPSSSGQVTPRKFYQDALDPASHPLLVLWTPEYYKELNSKVRRAGIGRRYWKQKEQQYTRLLREARNYKEDEALKMEEAEFKARQGMFKRKSAEKKTEQRTKRERICGFGIRRFNSTEEKKNTENKNPVTAVLPVED